MTTFTTYDQVGKAEDVSDIITNISPSSTPFFSMIKSEKVSARVFEWQEDSIRNSANNAKVEGAAFSTAARAATTLRSNNTQILSDTFMVSATSDAIKTYGRATETALQLGKALKAIKLDLERAYVGVDNAAVTGDSSTAREMASATQQISTSVDAGSNATDALTEAKIPDLAEDCYDNGSDPTVLMVKPADSRIVAEFATATGRNREHAQTKTLVNTIDVLVTPFGTYNLVMNREQLTTHAFLIDPNMWRSSVLRPFTRTLLGKDSDGDKHAIVGEYSLKHMSFSADGMITGLS